jgi:ubiquinone/menaquinone biosynthesis C-methylase UbiE
MSEEQRLAWEKKYEVQGQLWSRSHDRWFETKENERVLDLGCGSGKSCGSLEGEITAVDFSMTALRMLRDDAPALNLICCDASRLPLQDSQFDLVRASFIFGHMEEVERRAAIGEISRVLRPGGRLALEVFSKRDGRFQRRGNVAGDALLHDGRLLHAYFDEDQVRDALSGFKVIHMSEEKWAQRIGEGETMDRSIIRSIAIRK